LRIGIGGVGLGVGRFFCDPRLEMLQGLAGDLVERGVRGLVAELQQKRQDVLTVGGAAHKASALVGEPGEQVGPHGVEGRHVAVVDEEGGAVPKRVRVGVRGVAHGGSPYVGQHRGALRAQRFVAVRVALRGGLHLPEAGGGAVGDLAHAPAVRVGQATSILAALLDQGVLGVEQFAGGAGGMGGLEAVEATHTEQRGRWRAKKQFLRS
jgi:hypothetical protein